MIFFKNLQQYLHYWFAIAIIAALSVVVLISGFVMMYKPWYWLDPLLSILIAVFILKNCWTILKSSTNILMNATPGSLDLNDVWSHLLEVEDIKSAHYLHAWLDSSSGISFSCHLVVLPIPPKSAVGMT